MNHGVIVRGPPLLGNQSYMDRRVRKMVMCDKFITAAVEPSVLKLSQMKRAGDKLEEREHVAKVQITMNDPVQIHSMKSYDNIEEKAILKHSSGLMTK